MKILQMYIQLKYYKYLVTSCKQGVDNSNVICKKKLMKINHVKKDGIAAQIFVTNFKLFLFLNDFFLSPR